MTDPMRIVDHRPWPLPRRPWILAQRWHDVLFAHWRVPVGALRNALPPSLSLDLYEGEAWLGVLPFRASGVRPRFLPAVPLLSAFPEINVRTYVTARGKPGVFFFSLDAGNRLAAWLARAVYRLPYFHASIAVRADGHSVLFQSRRLADRGGAPGAEFSARYAPTGSPGVAAAGTLDHWLIERYCLYTVAPGGALLRVEIHHPPWALQPAEAEIAVNTVARPAGPHLRDAPPLLHYARRQDVRIWAPGAAALNDQPRRSARR